MAQEPINLFARIADPASVVKRLRQFAAVVKVDGPDDNWSQASITFVAGSQQRTLTFTHDPNYYAEPGWANQMAGMRGYFGQFPDTERKPQVMMLTTSLKFSLGTQFDPEFESNGDARLDVLFAVAEALDGVLFTPSSLRDANGRILFSAGGEDEEDPEAEWPRVIGEVPISDPLGAAMHEASRPKTPDEDDEDSDPPPAERVARRALALAAVTTRAILEQDKINSKSLNTYRDLLMWVEELELECELEPEECEVLQRPLGRLDASMQTNSTWRLEGLVVLAWALGRFEIPSHDQLVSVNPLWNSLHLLKIEAAQLLIVDPTLRPREELLALRGRLFAVHWRLRNFGLHNQTMDFAEFSRTCWFGPLDISGLPLVGGDLALGGKRIDKAARGAFDTARSAALERHQAINWLCEGPERYSEASVAT